MNKDFLFTTSAGNQIEISVTGKSPGKPVVIFVHGFKGFKDWGFGPYLADYFAKAGFQCLRFNFSHNGVGLGSLDFNEPEKFQLNSYSLEVSELSEILNRALSDFLDYNGEPVFLAGHSRGGAIAILSGCRNTKVTALAVWGTISSISRYTTAQIERWKNAGFIEVLNTRTGQRLKIGENLLNDVLLRAENELNIIKTIKSSEKPLLVMHGEQDLTVKKKEGEKLFAAGEKGSEFVLIPATGHTFGIVHPFAGTTPAFDTVLQHTVAFFKKFC